jgi:hypothetical protein
MSSVLDEIRAATAAREMTIATTESYYKGYQIGHNTGTEVALRRLKHWRDAAEKFSKLHPRKYSTRYLAGIDDAIANLERYGQIGEFWKKRLGASPGDILDREEE